jgi:hypothetical protein
MPGVPASMFFTHSENAAFAPHVGRYYDVALKSYRYFDLIMAFSSSTC